MSDLNKTFFSSINASNSWFKLIKIYSNSIFGFNGIMTIKGTTSSTVMSASFSIIATHDKTISCIQLGSCGYTQFSLRFFVNTTGDIMIEIANNINPSQSQNITFLIQLVSLDGRTYNVETFSNELSQNSYSGMILRSVLKTQYNNIVISSFV